MGLGDPKVNIIIAAKDMASGEINKVRNSMNGVAKSSGFKTLAQGFGMGMGISAWGALSTGIQMATDFMAESIGVASDLNESMSKAGVVFGDATDEVDRFAETSARSFGISKRAAYEATGAFGNLFTTMGFARDEAADMSVDITKLAADLASFHNIGIDEAMEKLRAGLVGETEPMRQLGVLLNAAAVEAKVLDMGLASTKGQITEAMKVTARYALIMEQTGTAQGDFARTSDGLANTQRTLNAELEDAQAALGEELLPAMVEVTKFARDWLVPAVDLATGVVRLFGYAVNGLTLPFQNVESDGEAVVVTIDNITRAQDVGIAAWNTYAQSVNEMNPGLQAHREETERQARASGAWSDRLTGLAGLVEDTGNAADTATPFVLDLAGAFKDAKRRSDEFRESFLLTLGALIDDANSPEVLTLELDSLNAGLSVARQRLRDLEAIENPTAEQRRDIADTKLQIKDYQKEIVLTETKLESLDGISLKDIKLMLRNLGKYGIDPLSQDARELWSILWQVAKIAPSGQGSAWRLGIQPRAEGGPVVGGRAYLVGEQGPELFVPSGSGSIIPNGASAGRGVSVSINIGTFNGTEANVEGLSRAIANKVRLSTVKGAS